MPADNPPKIDYTSRDWSALRTDLVDSIPTFLPEWTSRNDTDFGITMIELFAYVGDILNYYLDRIANESFLSTALQRQSVLNMADLYDYRPVGVSAARVDLQFTLASGQSSVTIPLGTKVTTSLTASGDPIIFETDIQLVIPGNSAATPQYTGVVAATEGETVPSESVGTSTGKKDQQFNLLNFPVISGSIVLLVDEDGGGPEVAVRWADIEHLVDYDPSDRVFTTRVNDQGITTVVFGDDVNGRIPPNGALITATYRVGQGATGNVGANTLTQLVQANIGVIAVTNPLNATGGSDAETLGNMRRSIPKSLRALNRAVTLEDYESLALQVSGVGLAKAAASVFTSINLYISAVGGGIATTALKNTVLEFLSTRKMIGATVTVLDPTYVDLDISCVVNVLPNYNRSAVSNSVESALGELFDSSNISFGQRFTLSSAYRAISSVPGVDYGVVTILDSSPGSGVADVSLASNQLPAVGTISVAATGGITGS